MTTYPAPTIPAGKDFAGDYYYEAIRLVHSLMELHDFEGWLNGLAFALDNEGRTVVIAGNYEQWVDQRRAEGVSFEADRQRAFVALLKENAPQINGSDGL